MEEYKDVYKMKRISDYPDYLICEDGDIYSIRSGIFMKVSKRNHKGYDRVHIRDKFNNRHSIDVHQLVLMAFVGPKPEGYVCRHLDGNPHNNNLENLCWGTQKENSQDAIKHGTAVCLRHGEKASASKLTLNDVRNIRKLRSEGLKLREIAEKYSITTTQVRDISIYKSWSKDR